eukprot:CAMPEP_0201283388 /NCGR_PEP_ID=MMETSP1317-20130820/8411_1 /ASSEMBLY_ACC=CAM_ASM_000770 /TAXON_ID=187299 /ORGANISM="Undescribed Undescribed, Strain Undescribed" /LENGTH=213 /DNA_ID=CAMNT_0047599449 /DNA_START=46 /DNA_END=684 /DNA_ORIENTATION=+
MVACLIAYVLSGVYLRKLDFHYIHESGVAMIIGLCFSLWYFIFGADSTSFQFEGDFFKALLPPILLAYSFGIRRGRYSENMEYILGYGIVGTLLNFIFNMLLVACFTHMAGYDFSYKECGLFAAIMVASDAVAGLSMIDEQDFPNLYSVIYGECMINNALAIILFYSFLKVEDDSDFVTFLESFGRILLNAVLSSLFGIGIGLFTGWATKSAE